MRIKRETIADWWRFRDRKRPGENLRTVQARTFAMFLLMHLTARVWLWDLRDDAQPQRLGVAIVVTLCFLWALTGSGVRRPAALTCAVLSLNLALLFPFVSNHYFLELICIFLVAFLDFDKEAESALFVDVGGRVAAVVLLSSGVQKVLHGTYFDGQFLGFLISSYDRFRDVFRWLMPSAEFERLASVGDAVVGAGPYTLESPLGLAASNAVWVLEIVFGLLLLSKKTRVFAAWGAIAFVLAIELGARELMFGALFVNLLLLFVPRPIGRFLLPFFAVGYLALHLVELVLPWKAFN